MGRFGQKTGAGWYKYEPGARCHPDPVVEKLIEDYRKEEGITPRKISDEEIVQRCILALPTRAPRSSKRHRPARQRRRHGLPDWLRLPVFRGGPMFYADTLGLYRWCG
jgi:3-hydroxyacyl-CoA dehydrogenase